MTDISRPVMRYHGGKYRLAPWVISHFPGHRCYVEPFGGAAGVLIQKERSYAEVYNDLDGDVCNLFGVLRSPEMRERLIEGLQLTPFARDEFYAAYELTEDPVERARRTLVRSEMGFGSGGATKNRTGFRIDTRRRYGTAPDMWQKFPPGLAAIGQRLMGVMIENRPAVDVILQHDGPDVLFYVDPPYLPETRVPSGGRIYAHEMSKDQHLDLLDVLTGDIRGMVVLSGYPSDLYERRLRGWTKSTTTARMAAARGTGLRTECLWINPACARALNSAGLELECTL